MNVFICDDDIRICEILETKLRTMFTDINVSIFTEGRKLLEAKDEPDIILLDIKMPDTDGMTLARRLRTNGYNRIIIFITGEKDEVFNAFDVDAFHYLIKPVKDSKFREVMDKAKRYLEEMPSSEEEKILEIQSGSKHIKIRLSDIVYAEVFDRKVVIHELDEEMEYYGRLSDLENKLGDEFFRIHRSFIINLKYVNVYDKHSVTMENGVNIRISRDKYNSFLKAYMDYNRGSIAL
ncbi:MAG: LytTR family DNA-binding domain-containing protein [Lachnospiraceae bacterium]|nr:LytTR family DNA-binding domain-containing protein [Lachnospiraceae bacterium]